MAFKIERINKRLKVEGIEKFKKSFDKGEHESYLKKLNKTDKIDLLHSLGLDVTSDMAYRLDKIKQVYRNVINKSIMDDQAKEHKDGIDTFVKYKKDSKKKKNDK